MTEQDILKDYAHKVEAARAGMAKALATRITNLKAERNRAIELIRAEEAINAEAKQSNAAKRDENSGPAAEEGNEPGGGAENGLGPGQAGDQEAGPGTDQAGPGQNEETAEAPAQV